MTCDAPEIVCEFARYILQVKFGQQQGNAVYLAPGLAVTNRHIILRSKTISVETMMGEKFRSSIVPSAYEGDLILLKVEGLDLGPSPLLTDDVSVGDQLFIVVRDPSNGDSRVYPPGSVILTPASGFALARLHHDASGGIGSDGGALITEEGHLAGIATTGGDRRGEAIPAAQVRAMVDAADESQGPMHAGLAAAYIRCDDARSRMPKRRARLARRAVSYLSENCRATRNGHLVESAARILGRAGHLSEARDLFAEVLNMDPHAINARLGLVVALLLGGGYGEALPHLKWLIDILPSDTEVLRLSIQAGKYGGDVEFAEEAYSSLRRLSPVLAIPLRRFLDAPANHRRRR